MKNDDGEWDVESWSRVESRLDAERCHMSVTVFHVEKFNAWRPTSLSDISFIRLSITPTTVPIYPVLHSYICSKLCIGRVSKCLNDDLF